MCRALLGEWGCDAELWKAVVSKSALIKLVEKGSEEYGRRWIARMRVERRRGRRRA